MLVRTFGDSLYKSYNMSDLIWGYHDPMMTMAMKILPQMFYTDFLGIYAGVCRHITLQFIFINCHWIDTIEREMEIYNIIATYFEVIVLSNHRHAKQDEK